MSAVDSVHVNLPGREYDVLIGEGLLADPVPHLADLMRRKRVFILTDATVGELVLPIFQAGLDRGGVTHTHLALPAGEGTKSWQGLTRACEWLLDQKAERKDLVIALGGGVIGDLAGFAAAIVRRGLRFVQVPTTLLAQVDSSVGGKTGINTQHGKNLIGAFHQPVRVLADIGALASLPPRDFRAGMGEVVKYGLLGDAEFWSWLEDHGAAMLAGDATARRFAVARSVAMKAGIVERDETEEGERALLNLGHTFCHALEAATAYGPRLLHGEGVAIGLGLAFDLSASLGLCSQEHPSRVQALLRRLGMKATLADIDGDLPDADHLVALMGQDKKVLDGKLRFILARDIGETFVASDVPLDRVRQILTTALRQR